MKNIVQELCESRGGRPGLSVLTSLLVSVDVKIYCTVLRHWSQLVLICLMTSEDISINSSSSTVKNTDYQAHSALNRKSEIIVTAVPLKHIRDG